MTSEREAGPRPRDARLRGLDVVPLARLYTSVFCGTLVSRCALGIKADQRIWWSSELGKHCILSTRLGRVTRHVRKLKSKMQSNLLNGLYPMLLKLF